MATSTQKLHGKLRRNRDLMRTLAWASLSVMILLAALQVYRTSARLISGTMTDSVRADTALEGGLLVIACLLGGFILYRMLRSVADVTDVLLESESQARRAADVVENQLLPLLHALQRQVALPEAERAKRHKGGHDLQADQSLRDAVQAVRDALVREWWHQAERLAERLKRDFPDSDEATRVGAEIAKAKRDRKKILVKQAGQAGRHNDWEALGRVRDRLSAFSDDAQLPELDNEVATELIRAWRELHEAGKRREAAQLGKHLQQKFGHTSVVATLGERRADRDPGEPRA